MYKIFFISCFFSIFFLSCGSDQSQVNKNPSNEEIRPVMNFSTEELSSKEVSSLQALCLSFKNMDIPVRAKHQFSYKKNTCSEIQETYRLEKQIDISGIVPTYVSNDRSLFYFPEIRFDVETTHPLSTYCKRSENGLNSRFNNLSNGISISLEVISNETVVNGQTKNDVIKNTKGCYDSSMLSANAANDLVCVRLWVDQKDAKGNITQKIYYETLTFVVLPSSKEQYGFIVHREKQDYLKCTNKEKNLVYTATRLK